MRYALSLLIVSILSSQSYAAVEDLWPMTDSAASVIVDATTGVDASMSGAAPENTVDCQTGAGPGNLATGALDFDGDDYISITGTSFSKATTVPFSLGIWAKFGSAGGWSLWGRTALDSSYVRKLDDNTLTVRLGGGTAISFDFADANALATGSWKHILVCKDNTDNVHAFVNGVPSTTSSNSQPGGSASMALQAIGNRNGTLFVGQLSYAKTYNSDESGNAAAIYAEGTPVGKPVIILQQFSKRKLINPLYAIMP